MRNCVCRSEPNKTSNFKLSSVHIFLSQDLILISHVQSVSVMIPLPRIFAIHHIPIPFPPDVTELLIHQVLSTTFQLLPEQRHHRVREQTKEESQHHRRQCKKNRRLNDEKCLLVPFHTGFFGPSFLTFAAATGGGFAFDDGEVGDESEECQ